LGKGLFIVHKNEETAKENEPRLFPANRKTPPTLLAVFAKRDEKCKEGGSLQERALRTTNSAGRVDSHREEACGEW